MKAETYMEVMMDDQDALVAGWDKIFYFFSQKFRPKQRKSHVTEGFQKSGNLGIKYVVYKSISS